jgi:hypothetical protein
MSEIKHTPLTGPWELVETHHDGILSSWHIQIGEDQVPVFPFKRVYSEDRTQSGFVTDHDRMAAFRVASAAPDLLEALMLVEDRFGAHCIDPLPLDLCGRITAAIAKATGIQSGDCYATEETR